MEGFELGIRGWMIIIGVLLILAVLLDGYRRVRNDRYGAIRMSRKVGRHSDNIDDDELFKSELPNGGARVVAKDERLEPELTDLSTEREQEQDTVQTGYAHDGQSADEILGLKPITANREEPSVPEDIDSDITAKDSPEPTIDTSPTDSIEAATEPRLDVSEARESSAEASKPEANAEQGGMHANVKAAPETAAQLPDNVEEVVAIKVLAKKGEKLNGEALLKILTACDCRYGAMGVFHRYEQAKAEGPIQFSVANIMEPGSFDLSTLESSSTPGVVFFVQLPGPQDPVQAYNFMIETAQCVANNLSAEMRDDTHNVMTAQTIEHGKQRVAEFERRRLAKKQK